MPSPSTNTLSSHTKRNYNRGCKSLSPGGGMLLPSSNQMEIVKGFISELTFWGDLQMVEQSEKRDDLVGHLLQRVSSSTSLESRRSVQQTTVEAAKSPTITGPVWRTAIDPHSGRTYYYDAITRRTQWDKPDEIRQIERQRRLEKRAQDLLFFQEMERNIVASLQSGELIPGLAQDSPHLIATPSRITRDEQRNACSPDVLKPARIRTISAMDHQVMADALKEPNVPHAKSVIPRPLRDAHGRPPLPSGRARSSALASLESSASLELSPEVSRAPITAEESTEMLRGEALLDGLLDDVPLQQNANVELLTNAQKPPQIHVRRNTGGTVYVKSTMMNPNIEATIKCVCGVYRTHILDFAAQRANRSPNSIMGYKEPRNEVSEIYQDLPVGDTEVPSQTEVMLFYKDFYQRSQMEHDTIIMSLIYVERLIKTTAGVIVPLPENWRSLLFSCMVLASKVWDDLSMWNIDFSNVCGRDRTQLSPFTLGRINQLELALLTSLNFNVKVPASEYAKYYFLIRGMLMKSGLLNERDEIDIKGAKNLDALICSYQDAAKKAGNNPSNGHRMTKSMNDYKWLNPTEIESGPLHTVFTDRLMPVQG